MDVKDYLVKAGVIVTLATVCAVLVYSLNSDQRMSSRRFRYIPRYLSEKEIRGPNYHVHHRIFENNGDDVNRVVLNNKYLQKDSHVWKLKAKIQATVAGKFH